MVALNAFPITTIWTVLIIPPCRHHAIDIYETVFEVEKCLSLPLDALYLCAIVECENGCCRMQQKKEKCIKEFEIMSRHYGVPHIKQLIKYSCQNQLFILFIFLIVWLMNKVVHPPSITSHTLCLYTLGRFSI